LDSLFRASTPFQVVWCIAILPVLIANEPETSIDWLTKSLKVAYKGVVRKDGEEILKI
jgi:hypothetical protein